MIIYKLRRQNKMIKTRIERLSGDDSESYHEVIRQNSAMKWGGEPKNWAQMRTV